MLKLDNLNVDRPMIVLQRHFIVHLMQFLVGRSSFEEVLMQLINSKCMPCLLYALEACPINKTQEKSLEFTINRVLMKIFRTVSIDVIT